MGGRLKKFLPQWEKISSDKFVLGVVDRGYTLEFSESPPSRFLITHLPKDKQKVKALPLLVGEWVDQGVSVPVPVSKEEEGKGFYSHVFLVLKPSCKYRLEATERS